MPDKRVEYEYAIIRYVPRVEREEFINIGVILFSKPRRFLDLKYKLSAQKLKALDPEADMSLLSTYLDAWKEICKGSKAGGAIGLTDINYRYRWLVANRSTVIQTSPTHPGLCMDPESELEKLYTLFVL
jgi:hypothetical protein